MWYCDITKGVGLGLAVDMLLVTYTRFKLYLNVKNHIFIINTIPLTRAPTGGGGYPTPAEVFHEQRKNRGA